MWPFHPVLCNERQLLYEMPFIPKHGAELFDHSGKRLIKNVLKDGKTIVDNYRQKLEKLRDDFLREVIVTVETNVFRILAEVTCLGQNIKEVDESIKKVGERCILKRNL